MTPQLISSQTAKLAREKGFPFDGSSTYKIVNILQDSLFGTPLTTQYLLQKWLRENHYIHINISKIFECSKNPAVFEHWRTYISGPFFETNYKINEFFLTKCFKTYEEALERGLREALKLI